MNLPFAESFKTKVVEPIRKSTREEREKWIKEANYNLFNLKSEQVFIDLLTDSGTGAMSDRQWSEIMLGDESYAGASSYYKLKNAIKEITGFEYFLPTHQGRAAENVLFSVLVKDGDLVPGNSHFDTTKGHIEFRKATAIDCTIDEAFDTTIIHPFKGNLDLVKLENVLKSNPANKISFIIVTITCNSSGGQPVSMQNLKEVYALAKKYGIKVIFDSARFAENAYFIKKREKAYKNKEDILKLDAFIAGVGTGGTVMGVGKFLKEQDSSIKIHPLEPANSPTLSTGHKVGKHRIQGISDEFIPSIVKLDELDSIVEVDDGDAIIMAQKLAQIGIGVGISSGANLLGALKIQNTLGKDAVVATIFSDDNKKYLSTDLLRYEPVKDGFLSSHVKLIGIKSLKRVCHTCCDPSECVEAKYATETHYIDLPYCPRRSK